MAKHNAAVMLITPAVILAVCGGIIAGAGYVPVQKMKAAADLIFSADTGHEQIK